MATDSSSSSIAAFMASVLSEMVLPDHELDHRRIGEKAFIMVPPLSFLPSGSSSFEMLAQSLLAIILRRPPAQKSRPRSMRGTYRVYACCRVTSVDSASAARGRPLKAAAAMPETRTLRRSTMAEEAEGEATEHERAAPFVGRSSGGSTSARERAEMASIS